MALVGTEVVNIIEPNSTNIILGPIWIDLVTQTWCNTYLKNWQICPGDAIKEYHHGWVVQWEYCPYKINWIRGSLP